jgi:hypothetical protein
MEEGDGGDDSVHHECRHPVSGCPSMAGSGTIERVGIQWGIALRELTVERTFERTFSAQRQRSALIPDSVQFGSVHGTTRDIPKWNLGDPEQGLLFDSW